MLVDEIKSRMLKAMKAHSDVEKEILRVALGEIQMAHVRGAEATDETTLGILRKLVKSNEETLGLATDPAQRTALAAELEVLRSILPKSLGVADIVAALAPVRDAIRAAASDGQATGVAMKHLKSVGATVGGKDVGEAVRQVRA